MNLTETKSIEDPQGDEFLKLNVSWFGEYIAYWSKSWHCCKAQITKVQIPVLSLVHTGGLNQNLPHLKVLYLKLVHVAFSISPSGHVLLWVKICIWRKKKWFSSLRIWNLTSVGVWLCILLSLGFQPGKASSGGMLCLQHFDPVLLTVSGGCNPSQSLSLDKEPLGLTNCSHYCQTGCQFLC